MRNDFDGNYLAHFGIMGMKWGVRRYQNEDGSLTSAGRERYGVKSGPVEGNISRSESMRKRYGVTTTSDQNRKITERVKKDPGTKSSTSSKELKNVLKSETGSRKSKALKEARKKDIDEMSLQELRETNNRLQEEKRYQDLTKGTTADGKKFVKEMGKAVVSGVVTGVFIEVGKKFVKARLGI